MSLLLAPGRGLRLQEEERHAMAAGRALVTHCRQCDSEWYIAAVPIDMAHLRIVLDGTRCPNDRAHTLMIGPLLLPLVGLVTSAPRLSFSAEDWFEIKGRGWSAATRLDRETTDFAHLIGHFVEIDGEAYRVLGVERRSHGAPWRAGEPISLLVGERRGGKTAVER